MKVKDIIIGTTIVLLLNSCAQQTYRYIQAVHLTPTSQSNSIDTKDGGFIFENHDCIVSYDMWAETGNSGFTILNKTDSILYIDLARSFFIANGMAKDYGTSIMHEAELVAIPPKSTKTIQQYNIMEQPYISCDLPKYPDSAACIEFLESESPLVFKNYISYRCGETGVLNHFENSFYIDRITNHTLPHIAVFKELPVPCKNQLTPTEQRNLKFRPKLYYLYYYGDSCSFYIPYQIDSESRLYDIGEAMYWSEKYGAYIKYSDQSDADGTPKNPSLRPIFSK